MCGRYSLAQPSTAIVSHFQVQLPMEPPARYNVAPGQPVLVVRERIEPGGTIREGAVTQWGLVPHWANDPSIGNRLINARAETLIEKPSFKGALKYHRCLIPADGFYEWKREGKQRIPHYIQMRDGSPFAFAGLWETWERAEGYLETCTIITTSANDLLRPLHERMPVILPEDRYEEWMNPSNRNGEALLSMLQPYPQQRMALYPVSDRVNKVGHEGRILTEPRPAEAPTPPDDQLSLI